MPEQVKKLRPVINAVDFVAGTTPREVITASRALIHSRGGTTTLSAPANKTILFDFTTYAPADAAASLGVDPTVLFGPHEFVPAVLPTDVESLSKAEADGKFFLLRRDWYRDPGITLENLGASGDQRIGFVLALLNENLLRTRFRKCLGECIDHDRAGQLLLAGFNTETSQRTSYGSIFTVRQWVE